MTFDIDDIALKLRDPERMTTRPEAAEMLEHAKPEKMEMNNG